MIQGQAVRKRKSPPRALEERSVPPGPPLHAPLLFPSPLWCMKHSAWSRQRIPLAILAPEAESGHPNHVNGCGCLGGAGAVLGQSAPSTRLGLWVQAHPRTRHPRVPAGHWPHTPGLPQGPVESCSFITIFLKQFHSWMQTLNPDLLTRLPQLAVCLLWLPGHK